MEDETEASASDGFAGSDLGVSFILQTEVLSVQNSLGRGLGAILSLTRQIVYI